MGLIYRLALHIFIAPSQAPIPHRAIMHPGGHLSNEEAVIALDGDIIGAEGLLRDGPAVAAAGGGGAAGLLPAIGAVAVFQRQRTGGIARGTDRGQLVAVHLRAPTAQRAN